MILTSTNQLSMGLISTRNESSCLWLDYESASGLDVAILVELLFNLWILSRFTSRFLGCIRLIGHLTLKVVVDLGQVPHTQL